MNDDQTNVTSNNETHTDVSISNVDVNENQNNLIDQQIQRKEIVLDKKIIFDCLKLYKSLEEKYTSKKENLDNLTEEEEDKMLMESEIFFIQLKKIEKIDNLDKYINLKELTSSLFNLFINELKSLILINPFVVSNLGVFLICFFEITLKPFSLAKGFLHKSNFDNLLFSNIKS